MPDFVEPQLLTLVEQSPTFSELVSDTQGKAYEVYLRHEARECGRAITSLRLEALLVTQALHGLLHLNSNDGARKDSSNGDDTKGNDACSDDV
jgi:hypothetical protein